MSKRLNVYLKASPRLEYRQIEHAVHWLEQYSNEDIIMTFSVDKVLRSAERWTEKLIQSAENVVELSDDVELIASLADGFSLVQLNAKSSFEYEGREMGHCIASYAESSGEYYSLRDIKNKPHCTIEICDGQLNQLKGKQNSFVVSKYVGYVIDALTYLNIDLSSSNDLENLGLLEISDDRLAAFNKIAGEVIPTCNIGEKTYINTADAYWKD